MYDEFTYILAFIIIGLFTFGFRATFLFYKPQLFENKIFSDGLESVPASLFVALVIPFTFFDYGVFNPFRPQVLAIILTVPVVHYIKKPGLSLIIAIVLYFIISYFLSIFL